MKCEYCDNEATHIDGSAVDVGNSVEGVTAYRSRPLCPAHAYEAATRHTSRLTRIEGVEDVCHFCGNDGSDPCTHIPCDYPGN